LEENAVQIRIHNKGADCTIKSNVRVSRNSLGKRPTWKQTQARKFEKRINWATLLLNCQKSILWRREYSYFYQGVIVE